MSAIWKYEIKVEPFVVEMPEGARILSVQSQYDRPQFWALVNPDAPKVKRYFAIVGTGQEFDATHGVYCGTFQTHGGSLVFHLFELDNAQANP